MGFARTVIALFLLGISAFALAYVYLRSLEQSEPPVEKRWEVEGTAKVPPGSLTVRFTGTTTLLFTDGDTQWMVDGWFSRPGILDYLFGGVAPDVDAVTRGLEMNEVTSLAAVIPLHSHYDHAMDAPEVARQTGALLMGSESTANIGRGWGLAENQIRVIQDRVPFSLGAFTITPVVFEHYTFPAAGQQSEFIEGSQVIAEPLVPPVAISDYRLGKAYALHVDHPKGDFLVVGSAGYKPSALEGLRGDVIFLSIGGLGAQSADYRDSYWYETVTATGARRVIPIHFDSLTAPLEGRFRGPGPVLKMLGVGGEEELLDFLTRKEAEEPGVEFTVLPRFSEVVLFE